MSPVNECIPFYEPGGALTCECEAAVIGKRFVDISDDIQGTGSPGLTTDVDGGNLVVSPASAGGTAFGVAKYNAAINEKVGVWTQPGIIVPVTADGAITAGAEVEVGTAGKAKTKGAANRGVGRAVADAADGADAMIQLYGGGYLNTT